MFFAVGVLRADWLVVVALLATVAPRQLILHEKAKLLPEKETDKINMKIRGNAGKNENFSIFFLI